MPVSRHLMPTIKSDLASILQIGTNSNKVDHTADDLRHTLNGTSTQSINA